MKRLFLYRFKRTSVLIVGCAGCLVGLALARKGYSVGVTGIFAGLLAVAVLSRKRTVGAVLTILLFGVCLGLVRGTFYRQKLALYEPLYDKKVSVIVSVLNDGTYNKSKQLTFDATNVHLLNGQKLPGKLQVSGFGLNGVFFGDELRVDGKLKTTLGSAQGRLSFARIRLVKHHPSWIGEIRRRFAVGLQNALPEPVNSFALGLLVGQRATLPQDIKDSLLMVGLTHIIAVSGYNLTIILRASKKLLASRSKRLSVTLSYGLIVVFLLITGFSASIVRAAIISGLTLYAGYYGRQFKPVLLILLVAAGTALVNPVFLWTDAGWYLSFLAFAGVMILSPLLSERLPVKLKQSTVFMIAVESLAAEMATLPYLLHTFGQMSLIGLVANTVVAVFIPLAMLLSALAGLIGIVSASLAGWFSWPATLLLTYMLNVAQLLSSVPHVFQKQIYLSGAATIELYAVVVFVWVCLYFKLRSKNSTNQSIITDKKAILSPLQERIRTV